MANVTVTPSPGVSYLLFFHAVWQSKKSMNKAAISLKLTLGPLRYHLVAHDDWGKDALSRLRANLKRIPFTGAPDRFLHLLEFRLSSQEREQVYRKRLPDRLVSILPAGLPRHGWKLIGDDTGHVSWCHPKTFHAIWTYNTESPHDVASFQLPWQPILEDIVKRRGGILHSGLVILGNQGYLLTAPQGGGKTTALSRIPFPWKVLGDDAALVWPSEKRSFRASPLPTWSVLLERNKAIPGTNLCEVTTSFEIAGIILLRKDDHENISPVQPYKAAQHLYRAFSEHVMVASNRDPFRKNLFYTACHLTRVVPTWEMGLTRHGDFWTLLQDTFSNA